VIRTEEGRRRGEETARRASNFIRRTIGLGCFTVLLVLAVLLALAFLSAALA
jgi:hypothetical protein